MTLHSTRISILLTLCALLLTACGKPEALEKRSIREDGLYRGAFIDGDSIQVNVEFVLKDNIVTRASFRHLRADENYRLNTEIEPYRSVIQQYHEALQHLVGKDIDKHLADLYRPESIIVTEVAPYTSATVRSNKILSAIRDALNRGVYSY